VTPPIPPGTGRDAALRMARRMLARAGIDDAALDARILLCEAAACDATSLARDPDHPLDAAAASRLDGFLARRLSGEPVFRILGKREFWGLDFALTAETLEPRPDTEAVVALALRQIASRRPSHSPEETRILDLGTGSGCILLALLHECENAFGIGIDRSAQAVATARANARALGLAARAGFLVGDWADALGGPGDALSRSGFDLIVSNPPYIESDVIAGLAREVAAYDPHRALDGGPDGLAPYHPLAQAATRLLRPGGRLVLEHGHDQAQAVAAIAQAHGFIMVDAETDLGGVVRGQAFGRQAETATAPAADSRNAP